MRVPLLNFEGGPGVLLLNFEGGPGVPLLNFWGVPGPTFKLWGGSRGPGPTFTPCLPAEFWLSRSKLCENCALPQNFHARKLGEFSTISYFTATMFCNLLRKINPFCTNTSCYTNSLKYSPAFYTLWKHQNIAGGWGGGGWKMAAVQWNTGT